MSQGTNVTPTPGPSSRLARGAPTGGLSWRSGVALLIVMSLACLLMPWSKAYAKQQWVVQMQVILTHPAEVNALCQKHLPKEKWDNLNGCWIQMAKGRGKLIAREPHNWCDAVALETIGHEVVHSNGRYHSVLYRAPTVEVRDCRYGGWVFDRPGGPK